MKSLSTLMKEKELMDYIIEDKKNRLEDFEEFYKKKVKVEQEIVVKF
jgi:hypothetical protein